MPDLCLSGKNRIDKCRDSISLLHVTGEECERKARRSEDLEGLQVADGTSWPFWNNRNSPHVI